MKCIIWCTHYSSVLKEKGAFMDCLELSLEPWRLRTYLNFLYLVLTRALLDFCTAKQTSCQDCSFLTAPLGCKLIKLALAIVPACSCLLILSTEGPVPLAERDLFGILASSVACPAAQMEELTAGERKDNPTVLTVILSVQAVPCQSKLLHFLFVPQLSLVMPRLTDAHGKYILESTDTVKLQGIPLNWERSAVRGLPKRCW